MITVAAGGRQAYGLGRRQPRHAAPVGNRRHNPVGRCRRQQGHSHHTGGQDSPPSLTVSPSDPIEIPYNGIDGKLYVLLTVTAENTEWSAKATDAEGNALDWATATASTGEGYINLSFTRNTQKQPRSGLLVVTPTAEGLNELRIPITQTAAPDHLTTLDGDRPHNAGP